MKRVLYLFLVISLIILGCVGMSIKGNTEQGVKQLEGKVVIAKEVWEEERGVKVRKGRQLYIMNADGSNYHPLPNGLFHYIEDPIWSPDGKKIIFAGEREEDDMCYIYITDERGIIFKKVCAGLFPSFSPDGEKIIFINKDNEICTIRANGTGFISLTHSRKGEDVHKSFPSFSSDEKKILFRGYKEYSQSAGIFVMDITTSDLKEVFSDNDVEICYKPLYWSPDDKKIVFIGKQKEKNEICIINSDGTDLKTITKTRKRLEGYKKSQWSSDGKKIMYTLFYSTDWPLIYWQDKIELHVMNADGTNDKTIMKFKGIYSTVDFDFDWWTPKGSRVGSHLEL